MQREPLRSTMCLGMQEIIGTQGKAESEASSWVGMVSALVNYLWSTKVWDGRMSGKAIHRCSCGMSVPDSEQLIKIAVILETTVSELLGTQVENEEEPDRLAKELSRINTQLAIRNHRTRRVLKIIAVALLVFVALIFAIMALNYAPMSQSKYTKRDAALLLPNRTDVISVSISCDDERETITDKREIDDLFANLSTVRIKSGESYNDSPMTDKFIKIFFEVSDGLSGCVVYVFEDENGFFIEQPYSGIFSIEEKQYAEIFETLF